MDVSTSLATRVTAARRQLNDRLSLQRAQTVKQMMVSEVATVANQLQTSGVGYRQNIVGTGADDATDAVDRRVEFKVVECKR